MTVSFDDITWHRAVGQLIDALDKPNFWAQLVRLLETRVVAIRVQAEEDGTAHAVAPHDAPQRGPVDGTQRGLRLLTPLAQR